MRRSLVLIGSLIGPAALAACGPASKPVQAAAPAATSAEAPHYWATVSDKEYVYYPRAHAQGGKAAADATTVRYLGRQPDGAWLVSEAQAGTVILASCLAPCDQVRMRGGGLDHTGPFGGDSVTRAALDDAIQGHLVVYAPPR